MPGAYGPLAGSSREVPEGLPGGFDPHGSAIGAGHLPAPLEPAAAGAGRFRARDRARARKRDRGVRQGRGPSARFAVRRGGGVVSPRPEAQSEFRRVARQPDSDRHGERRLRVGEGMLRAPARTAPAVHRGPGGPGGMGFGQRRFPDGGQVLHAAGGRRPEPLRGLVQSGPGAPEGAAPAAGRRRVPTGHQGEAAVFADLHQPGHRAPGTGRAEGSQGRLP